jgi:Fe-S cluster biogenesis protein NfuA
MRRKIESLLEEQVRPGLAAHGGNVEVVDVDNNQVFLKLTGGCHGCSSSSATLKQGIEKVIKQHFPEVEEIIDLTDHKSGENPYM